MKSFTIRQQLFGGSITVVGFTVAITLAVCLGLIFGLSLNVQSTAKSQLTNLAQSQLLTNAKEVAAALNQTLQIVSQSMSMVETIQAQNLIENTNISPGYQLPTQLYPSYREYNFVDSCVLVCPDDYGPLGSRSRISGYSGSIKHSSVYIFDSKTYTSLRSDTVWNSAMNSSKALKASVEALGILDNDFVIQYTQGPSLVAIFYSAVMISPVGSDNYYAIRRTFPGIEIENITYDPALRPWFQHAPEGYINIYGPYVETFTKELVFTLSSKESFTLSSTEFTVVGASVVFLKDLASFVMPLSYLKSGFVALVKISTLEVLTYGNQTTYDTSTGAFFARNSGVFSYSRSTDGGSTWYCSYVPFFPAQDGISAVSPSFSLVILYFAKESEALSTLPVLSNKVSSTTNDVTYGVVIGSIVIFVVAIVIVYFITKALTVPLHMMKVASRAIIHQATEEVRDYSEIIENIVVPNRNDELAVLASHMRIMAIRLQKTETEKRNKPKYPVNKFQGFVYKPWQWREQMMNPTGDNEVHTTEESKYLFAPPKSQVESKMKDLQIIDMKPLDTPEEVVVDMSDSVKLSNFWSLRTQIIALNLLILLIFVAVMVACVVILSNSSGDWLNETGNLVQSSVESNLNFVSSIKSGFLSSFFQQFTIDGLVLNKYFGDLNDGKVYNGVKSSNIYPLDQDNTAKYMYSSSFLFSGYYLDASAFCAESSNCMVWQNTNETITSSLLDLKFTAYNHPESILSYIQTGLDSDGYTRIYPYQYKAYAYPTSCTVENDTNTICSNKQMLCNQGKNPSYDARCRSWYQLGFVNQDSPNNVYFESPRVSSSGTVVVTAMSANRGSNGTSPFYGVMSQNILASSISAAVNQLQILTHGYAFVLGSNLESIILYPQQGSCTTLYCAETSFSESEYSDFENNVLLPILQGQTPANSYIKGGNQWAISSAPVDYGTVAYTLFLTVPQSDILATITSIQNSINSTIIWMIVGFVILIVVASIIMLFFAKKMIERIIRPIEEITNVCLEVINNNLERNMPSQASSLDMKVMLEAFGGMIIALRFGSESYAKGDLQKAHRVFTDALALFETISNKRGIGIAHNNLAAVLLAEHSLALSHEHYVETVKNAREMIEELEDTPDQQTKWKKILSDRLGNYALLLIEMKQFPEAFKLLEEAFEIDSEIGNTHGWVVKQGSLGLFFLAQNENKDGLKVFQNTLTFIDECSEDDFKGNWNLDEIPVARQVALHSLGNYYATMGELDEAERYFLDSIRIPKFIDISTLNKTLQGLLMVYQNQGRRNEIDGIHNLMKELGLNPSRTVMEKKHVIFALDYSGSMSGMKINSAVDSILTIFDQHMSNEDELMMMQFNDNVTVSVPMVAKRHNPDVTRASINKLRSPQGGTALFDAIAQAVSKLHGIAGSGLRWIVVLTDGEDNRSRITVDALKKLLSSKSSKDLSGVIIIGVGGDVKVDLLMEIAEATNKGMYIQAESDRESISKAFAQVVEVIQGQLMIEVF